MVLLIPSVNYAQVDEYMLKGIFLERFTRFIEWPSNGTEDFDIVVVGKNPFNNILEQLYGYREIKGRPVKIHYISDYTEIPECELLFISSSESKSLNKIIEFVKDKPVLTVGDTEGYAEKGVIINFYPKEVNIHFEINENAIKQSRLKFNHLLLTMARIVE